MGGATLQNGIRQRTIKVCRKMTDWEWLHRPASGSRGLMLDIVEERDD
jgi:hypothetical protein